MDKKIPLGIKILIGLFVIEALSRIVALINFFMTVPPATYSAYEIGIIAGLIIALALFVAIVLGLFKLKKWGFNLCLAGLILEAIGFSLGFSQGFSQGIGSDNKVTTIVSFSIVFLMTLVGVFFIGRYLYRDRIKNLFD